MAGLQPPQVPAFYPLIPAGTVPAEFNTKVRDPLTYLESKVVFRARRTTAWNVNSAAAHRFVPWNSAGIDEDGEAGWTNPADLGGGASTTLNGATAVGAATFVVTSATGLAVGDYVRIGPAGASQEHRQIKTLAGTTVTPGVPGGDTIPLALAHSNGDAVVEVVSDPSVYLVEQSGWFFADACISISNAQVTVAAQVLIPGISVNETSPLLTGNIPFEGCEQFQAAAAVTHTSNGLWEFWANAGDRIRLDYFLSSETTGNIAVDTTIQCRLGLVWFGA